MSIIALPDGYIISDTLHGTGCADCLNAVAQAATEAVDRNSDAFTVAIPGPHSGSVTRNDNAPRIHTDHTGNHDNAAGDDWDDWDDGDWDEPIRNPQAEADADYTYLTTGH